MQQTRKQSKFYTVFLLALAIAFQSIVPHSARAADSFQIPEIDNRSPELFVLDSVAKLDDFIEIVEKHMSNRSNKGWSFVASAAVQVVAISGVVIDVFFFKTKVLTPFSGGLKDASTVGKVGNFGMDSLTAIRRWSVGSGVALNVPKDANEKIFKVHPEDLPQFKEALVSIRSTQYSLLMQLLRAKSKTDVVALGQYQNIDRIIRESRPSFLREYEACIKDTETYKDERYMRAFKKSLKAHFLLLFFSGGMINEFADSWRISPPLHHYLSQSTLPSALDKCLNPGEVMGDAHANFVLKLHAADFGARLLVVSILYLLARSQVVKKEAAAKGAPKVPAFLQKIMSGWVGNIVNNVKTLFAKISPKLIARAIAAVQLISSSIALYDIKKEWDEVRDETADRHTMEEFLKLGKKYFLDRANAEFAKLTEVLKDPSLDLETREEAQEELEKWALVISEINTATLVGPKPKVTPAQNETPKLHNPIVGSRILWN